MLKELRFVQGAVAKKDFIPALTHFAIEPGRVRGYNGMLALCSPLPFDIACNPKADVLIRAIANCDDTVTLSMTPGGRLSVKSGKFKALVNCVDGETPHVEPEGDHIAIDGDALLGAVRTAAPFIGNDASRPWSNGVLFRDDSAFATNNVCLVQCWTGVRFPFPVNIPESAVKEMLRIDEAPVSAQVAENSVTFHYGDNRWLRTQLLSTEWPDLERVLNCKSDQRPLDQELFDVLAKLKPFVDKQGHVYMANGVVSTSLDPEAGASYELESATVDSLYNIEMLALLQNGVTTIDWTGYPGPCMFHGERFRGAIIGMRK